MDPILALTSVEAAKPILEELNYFFKKIAGPYADEMGLMFADNIRLFRFKNQLQLAKKAEKMIHDSGYEPKQIPLRTLFPIFENASLEDNDFLSEKWAALLANASIGEAEFVTHPSFPKILSEIEPNEARLLNAVFSKHPLPWPETRNLYATELEVTERKINEYYDNLFRLGLLRLLEKDLFMDGHRRNVLDISQFGEWFIIACTAPAKK